MQITKKPLTRFVGCSCEHVVLRFTQAFAKHLREKLGGLEMGKRTLPLCHSHWGLGWLGNDKQKFVTLVRWWDSPIHLRDVFSLCLFLWLVETYQGEKRVPEGQMERRSCMVHVCLQDQGLEPSPPLQPLWHCLLRTALRDRGFLPAPLLVTGVLFNQCSLL